LSGGYRVEKELLAFPSSLTLDSIMAGINGINGFYMKYVYFVIFNDAVAIIYVSIPDL
jgi:hypothetical protein